MTTLRRAELQERFERATGLLLLCTKTARPDVPGENSIIWTPRGSVSFLLLAGHRVGVGVRVRAHLVGLGYVDWKACRDLSGGYKPRSLRRRFTDWYQTAKAAA